MLKCCRILFAVHNIVNNDSLSCVHEDLFLILIQANFQNTLSAVQLATEMVRYIRREI